MKKYIFKKNSISTINGGLWSDFIVIYWVFEYLNHLIMFGIKKWSKNG
jgi:hypothetical protein